MSEIDYKIREAWQWSQQPTMTKWPWKILANAYINAEARARMFMWQRDHPGQRSRTLEYFEKQVREELEK